MHFDLQNQCYLNHTNHFFALEGPRKRYLFFHCFVKDQKLIFISSFYPDIVFNFAEVSVVFNGKTLVQFQDVGTNACEPIRAIIYPLVGEVIHSLNDVVVSYQGRSESYRVAPTPPITQDRAVVATLFKENHWAIPSFYRYYKQQGVEQFILFYNGELSSIESELFKAEGIYYSSWNFQYWLDGVAEQVTCEIVDPAAFQNYHHAQAAFISLVQFLFLPGCRFLFLIDLDEYLWHPEMRLTKYLEKVNLSYFSIRNYWASWDEKKWDGEKSWSVLSHPSHTGLTRLKTIYRGDFKGDLGVHYPKCFPEPRVVTDAIRMFHIYELSKPKRKTAPGGAPILFELNPLA